MLGRNLRAACGLSFPERVYRVAFHTVAGLTSTTDTETSAAAPGRLRARRAMTFPRLCYSATPLPDSATFTGLLALVDTTSFAERLPVTVGVNVTPIVHDAPAASTSGQLWLCA